MRRKCKMKPVKRLLIFFPVVCLALPGCAFLGKRRSPPPAPPAAAPQPVQPAAAAPKAVQAPQAAAPDPNDPAVLLAKAEDVYRNGSWPDANDAFNSVLKVLPKDDPRRARVSERLGRLAQRAGDCRTATKYFSSVERFETRLHLKDDALSDALSGLEECKGAP